ncbi:MAG: hypothetical protein JRN35_08350 [Nitrososphaerota archaeon]|nr:hypothetical protein [Nitrososphaerota archaeon]
MKIQRELESLYQGGLPSKTALQNDPQIKNLAGWLIESTLNSRWQFYRSIIRPVAESGGQIVLCERHPNDTWTASLVQEWRKSSRTAGLSILISFSAQQQLLARGDLERISQEIIPFAASRDWIVATGEAMMVCASGHHFMLSDWKSVRALVSCHVCRSEVFKFFPATIASPVKEAILKGMLVEMASAVALTKAGGVLFRITNKDHLDHYVSLPFHHPISPIEVDAVGDLGETLLVVECKDIKDPGTLNITDIESTASKANRLINSLGDTIGTNYRLPPRLVIITTGQLHKSLDRERVRLAKGELSDLPCYVIDQSSLPSICKRLSEIAIS